jgi:arylsulfatase A-like enzyme
MADDLGYGDLGSFGQVLIRTPHLDRLAHEGMRFTQYYAGSAACNPSRFAFSTGKHAGTTGVTNNGDNRLPPDIMTVGRVMQEAGYRTGVIGKWALGDAGTGGEPLMQGFDYFLGYPTQNSAHNFYPEALTENLGSRVLEGNKDSSHKLVAQARQSYAPEIMQRKALDFIRENSQRRFYLQLDLNLPHVNNELHALLGNGFEHPGEGRYAAKADWTEQERAYAEMVSLMDDYVGEIIETLHSLGLENNTLVIFTSDNGPAGERTHESLQRFAAVGPLSGRKGSLYEGGIRVPMIAWWPGTIPAGTTSNATVTAWDELSTLAELTDSSAKFESDGMSFAPVLKGASDPGKERFLYWQFRDQVAVRYGDWKFLSVRRNTFFEENFLFNIALDPREINDLAKDNPEKLQQLVDMAKKLDRH